MEKVLVTGAAGFIGSHVTEYFINKGFDVKAIDLVDITATNKLSRLSHLGSKLNFMPIDLSSEYSINKLFSLPWKPNYIINLASESHVDKSIDEPRQVWLNNTELILNILQYAEACSDLKVFLQFSTDEVYGPSNYPISEWHRPTVPSNPYAASKAAQEALAISWWRTYKLPLVIVNSTNVIGERQHPEKFLPKIIKHLKLGLEMPIYGDLSSSKEAKVPKTGSRNYLDVRDLCRAIHAVLSVPMAKFENGAERPVRFHVAGPYQITNLEMLEMVAKCMGVVDYKYKIVPFYEARPGHDLCYNLNIDKINQLCNWTHRERIEDTVDRVVKWFISNEAWLNEPVFST